MRKQVKIYGYLTLCVTILSLSVFLAILVNYSGIENMQTKTILPSSEKLPALSPELKSQIEETLQGFVGGFLENKGQKNEAIYYYTKNAQLAVAFSISELYFNIFHPSPGHLKHVEPLEEQLSEKRRMYTSVTLSFLGSNPVIPVACEPTGVYCHFFRGSDPANWSINNQYYTKLIYHNLYEHIDLVYEMKQGQLKYEFFVYPGGRVDDIQLRWRGPVSLELLEQGMQVNIHQTPRIDGDLAPVFSLVDTLPITYQSLMRDHPLLGSFKFLDPTTYGFFLPTYDPTKLLIIDPLLLTHSTYVSGSDHDSAVDIALDDTGNAYITGFTSSNDFPTVNAYDATGDSKQRDVFVCKLAANGSSLLYSTYVSGIVDDEGTRIAVDAAGNAYVTGYTRSFDFPTVNAYMGFAGDIDVFVFKLATNGSTLLYSTYVGGSDTDIGTGIAVDTAGNGYVTGRTLSTDFPTVNAYDGARSILYDAFVFKLATNGSTLLYSTYLGGNHDDAGGGIAVDAAGNAYVTGRTDSTDFPTVNAYDALGDGTTKFTDAYVCKLAANGSSLLYSTYVSGSSSDRCYGIAVDAAGNAYVSGYTYSTDFPTVNAYDAIGDNSSSTPDVVVCKLAANGSSLLYSTYVSGSSYDYCGGIALDAKGNAYVTGSTNSIDFPTVDAFDATGDGNSSYYDAFAFKLATNGSTLLYSTYLGGNESDSGTGIAVDESNGYVTGYTYSTDFPTLNAYDSAGDGSASYGDVFITKFQFDVPPVITTQPTQLNATEGEWFTYDFNASSTPPGPLTWTLWGNGTAWLTINSNTGVVMGTPNYLTGENWNVTVVVTDMKGLNATYMVPLNVQPAVLVFAEVPHNQNVWLFDIMTLRVRVNTTDGQPRSDIPVDWRLDGELLGTNTTDADGFSYWTLQLTTARAYQLLAQVPGRELSTEIYIVMNPLSFWFNGQANETESVWLPLGANYMIAGQLVDGEGQPVEEIELSYQLNDYSFTPLVTDANGWVNLTQPFLSEGTYILTVTKDGQALFMNGHRAELIIHVLASPTVVEQITPATNTTETVVNRPTVFVARIYFDDLTPVALLGARIGLLVNGSLVDSQFSDANGYVTFAYTFLTSGTYFVTFYYNGRSWGGVWVTVTMGYFALCPGGASLNGTVGQELEITIFIQTNTTVARKRLFQATNGTPVIGAEIDWYINGVYQGTTLAGAEGRTTFRHTFSTLGQYTVVAKHKGQILATFTVTITEAPLWEFISENFGLLVLLLVISALLVVGSRIPVVRQKTQRAFRRLRTKLERRALSTAAFYAREFAPELEESLGRQTLETARSDPRQKERVRRKVSTLLLRDPEIRALPRQDRLKLVDQTTEQVLARYKQKEADKS